MSIYLTAKTIKQHREQINAINVLDLEIESVELNGYWCDETKSEAKENFSNNSFCNALNNTSHCYSNNDTGVNSWDKVKVIGSVWIELESGLKVRFPDYVDSDGYYAEAALIVIKASNKAE